MAQKGSNRCMHFMAEMRTAATFLSNVRQPAVGFLHSWAVILRTHFWANRLYKSKDTLQYQFGSVKVYQKRTEDPLLVWLPWLEVAMIFDTTKTPPTMDSKDEDNNNNKAQKKLLLTFIPVPFPFPRKIISWAHEISAASFL